TSELQTRPTKTASPPMRLLPTVRRASSAPTSKSRSWTRTLMGSAAREGREEGDFARARKLHVEGRGALVDGGAEGRTFGERLGMAGAATAQPDHQIAHRVDPGGRSDLLLGDADGALHPGEVADFHFCTPDGGASSAMWRRTVRS